MKKSLVLGVALLLASSDLFAQNELSNFTATGRAGVVNTFVNDYQSIGINPANLGRSNPALVSFSIGEFGLGVSSQSMTKEELNKFIWNGDQPLTQEEKQGFARSFNNENALNLNADATTFAISFQMPVFGGIAINNRQRVNSHIGLNKNASEILFLGKDAPIYQDFDQGDSLIRVSEAFEGTSMQISWLNEWNLAYGRKLVNMPAFKLNAGVGLKYIEGIGVMDIRVEDGSITAYSALSPLFEVDYNAVFTDNPDFDLRTQDGGKYQSVGTGKGLDLGVSGEVAEVFRFGLSVIDLGTMTWKGNLLTANDQMLEKVESNGIETFNLIKEVANLMASGNDSILRYEPQKERKENLPTRIRAGVGFKLGEKVETGLDVAIPLNDVAGNLPAPFVGLGLDFKPAEVLRLSTGISAGAGNKLAQSLGFTVITPVYEFGVGTRDVFGLFSKDNPYASIAFGFLRFKVGSSD
jgi:hypothetical protein